LVFVLAAAIGLSTAACGAKDNGGTVQVPTTTSTSR
jgi:hypothetical protein